MVKYKIRSSKLARVHVYFLTFSGLMHKGCILRRISVGVLTLLGDVKDVLRMRQSTVFRRSMQPRCKDSATRLLRWKTCRVGQIAYLIMTTLSDEHAWTKCGIWSSHSREILLFYKSQQTVVRCNPCMVAFLIFVQCLVAIIL